MKITGGSGIYLLTHIDSGRKYVGQSTNIYARLRSHAYGLGGGAIGRAVLDHGWDAFKSEILEECPEEELNTAEQRWIAAHASMMPNGFNTHSGGNRPGLGDGFIGASTTQRQARSRKARAEAGGKQIAVMLTPSAAAKLAAWVAKGETIAGLINRMLTKSRP